MWKYFKVNAHKTITYMLLKFCVNNTFINRSICTKTQNYILKLIKKYVITYIILNKNKKELLVNVLF